MYVGLCVLALGLFLSATYVRHVSLSILDSLPEPSDMAVRTAALHNGCEAGRGDIKPEETSPEAA